MIFYGKIQRGAMIVDYTDKYEAFLKTLEGKEVEVDLRKLYRRRSSYQNRWYWGCIIAEIAGYTGYTVDEAHEAMKWMFLKVTPDDHRLPPTVKSTKNLTTMEFADFCESVRLWANENLGLDIPDPTTNGSEA